MVGVSDWVPVEEALDESALRPREPAKDIGELETPVASVAQQDGGGLSDNLFGGGGGRWKDSGDRPRLVGEYCMPGQEESSVPCRR